MQLKSQLVVFTILCSNSVLAAPTTVDTDVEAWPVCLTSKRQACPGVRINWQGEGCRLYYAYCGDDCKSEGKKQRMRLWHCIVDSAI